MSKFERFFSSDKLMIVSFVITLIAYALLIIMRSISIADDLRYIFYVAFYTIMFFIALAMYRSFARHEVNAMNIVTGAVTGILLIFLVQICVSNIMTAMSLFLIINPAVEVVLYAVLLINHVQINSIHRNTRGRILLNQVILLVISAYQIFLIVSFIVQRLPLPDSPEMMFACIILILNSLARIFICFMIICIETKLNAYKTDRDAAKAGGSWTYEKKAETKEKYFGK